MEYTTALFGRLSTVSAIFSLLFGALSIFTVASHIVLQDTEDKLAIKRVAKARNMSLIMFAVSVIVYIVVPGT